MDFEKETQNLGTGFTGERLEWFKPGTGQHKVTFKTDGEEFKATFDGEEKTRVRFEIEVNGETLNWGVNKSKTFSSVFGQIALLGKEHGTLVGKTFTVVVTNSNNRRNYTIMEAVPLIEKAEAAASTDTTTSEPISTASQ